MAKLEIPSIVVNNNGSESNKEQQEEEKTLHTSGLPSKEEVDVCQGEKTSTAEMVQLAAAGDTCGGMEDKRRSSQESDADSGYKERDKGGSDGGISRQSSDQEREGLLSRQSSDSDSVDKPDSSTATRHRSNPKVKLLQRSHALRDDTSPPPDIEPLPPPSLPPSGSSNNLTVTPNTTRDKHGKYHRLGKEGSSPGSSLGSFGSFEGSSPSLSRDSSLEAYTDSTGVDLNKFIIDTLNKNQKDRLMMLKLEQDFTALVKDSKRLQYRYNPMTSYNRMLVHRVAAFFGFDHNVDQQGTSVIVNKTKNTRIPDMKFSDYTKDELLPEEPKRSILKRDSSFEEGKDYKNSDWCLSSDVRRSKSYEEREEEYEKVKARIFQQDSTSSLEGIPADSPIRSLEGTHNSSRRSSQEDVRWPLEGRPWSSTDSDSSSRLLAGANRPVIMKTGASTESEGSLHSPSSHLGRTLGVPPSVTAGKVWTAPPVPEMEATGGGEPPTPKVQPRLSGKPVLTRTPELCVPSPETRDKGVITKSQSADTGRETLQPRSRPAMSKASSFGGISLLSRSDSIASSRAAGQKLTKAESFSSSSSPYSAGHRRSPISKQQSPCTPSPCPTPCTPPTLNVYTPYQVQASQQLQTLQLSSQVMWQAEMTPPACGSATNNHPVIWVHATPDSIPAGSILMNSQTGQPYLNPDGTLMRLNSGQTFSTPGSNPNPPINLPPPPSSLNPIIFSVLPQQQSMDRQYSTEAVSDMSAQLSTLNFAPPPSGAITTPGDQGGSTEGILLSQGLVATSMAPSSYSVRSCPNPAATPTYITQNSQQNVTQLPVFVMPPQSAPVSSNQMLRIVYNVPYIPQATTQPLGQTGGGQPQTPMVQPPAVLTLETQQAAVQPAQQQLSAPCLQNYSIINYNPVSGEQQYQQYYFSPSQQVSGYTGTPPTGANTVQPPQPAAQSYQASPAPLYSTTAPPTLLTMPYPQSQSTARSQTPPIQQKSSQITPSYLTYAVYPPPNTPQTQSTAQPPVLSSLTMFRPGMPVMGMAGGASVRSSTPPPPPPPQAMIPDMRLIGPSLQHQMSGTFRGPLLMTQQMPPAKYQGSQGQSATCGASNRPPKIRKQRKSSGRSSESSQLTPPQVELYDTCEHVLEVDGLPEGLKRSEAERYLEEITRHGGSLQFLRIGGGEATSNNEIITCARYRVVAAFESETAAQSALLNIKTTKFQLRLPSSFQPNPTADVEYPPS